MFYFARRRLIEEEKAFQNDRLDWDISIDYKYVRLNGKIAKVP